jgi:DNA-binding beta-propeller fold protein YncE
LVFSRDATRLFVTNRSEGSISVLDAYTGALIALWRLPGGGSPDMGKITADGAQLWVFGRYNSVVYVVSTTAGTLLHTIKVGNEPHGLAVWPQPGRYSRATSASPADHALLQLAVSESATRAGDGDNHRASKLSANRRFHRRLLL